MTFYKQLIVTFALSSTISDTWSVLNSYADSEFFHTPLLFGLKFRLFPLE